MPGAGHHRVLHPFHGGGGATPAPTAWLAKDYRAYWHSVEAELDASLRRRRPQSVEAVFRSEQWQSACPARVFIYNLSKPFADAFNMHRATAYQVFGKPHALGGHVRMTSQYAFSMALYYRLARSRCRTSDPATATLFFVPVLPRKRRVKDWQDVCANPYHGTSAADLTNQLPHLTRRTAHRHVLVFAHEHVDDCLACKGWWSQPLGLLTHALRVAYSHALPARMARAHNYLGGYGALYAASARHYPNLLSVPLLSQVHWYAERGEIATRFGNRTIGADPAMKRRDADRWDAVLHDTARDAAPSDAAAAPADPPPTGRYLTAQYMRRVPWANRRPRPILMLYMGGNSGTTGSRGSRSGGGSGGSGGGGSGDGSGDGSGGGGSHNTHGDAASRDAIFRACARYNESVVCVARPYRHIEALSKQQATFCLEPSGDTFNRKSISDSVTLGCIPVLFNNWTDHLFRSWGIARHPRSSPGPPLCAARAGCT